MATELTGSIQVKRIIELLEKVLVEGDLPNYSIAIDSGVDSDTKKMPLNALRLLFSAGIYRPTTQPAVSGGTLTIDAADNQEVIVEPRTSVGTRTISSNFTLAFSNEGDSDLIHCIFVFTGPLVVTMPSDVEVIEPLPSFASWDTLLQELTLTLGTDEKVEFDFIADKTMGTKSLTVSGTAS